MSCLASTALLVPLTSSIVNSNLLFNLLHPSTCAPCDLNLTHASSPPESSSVCSGTTTRAHSYSLLPALPGVLSRSAQALRTPGQDPEVRRTLVPHSATGLLLKVVGESSHLPLLPCQLLLTIQVLILRLFKATHLFDFSSSADSWR